MSCNEIERRFSIKELDLIIDAFEDVIKENEDYKGSSLLSDNCPNTRKVLKKFKEYHKRLEEHIKICQETISNDGFRDWYVRDDELYLQATIGVILPLEDCYILYFYLDNAVLTGNRYKNNIIINLRNELSKEIAFTTSWKYMCENGLEKTLN